MRSRRTAGRTLVLLQSKKRCVIGGTTQSSDRSLGKIPRFFAIVQSELKRHIREIRMETRDDTGSGTPAEHARVHLLLFRHTRYPSERYMVRYETSSYLVH